MDLLGNIGNEDQLTSAREENKLLQSKCKELSIQVRLLTVENESLKAEIEMYRAEMVVPTFSSLALGDTGDGTTASTNQNQAGNNHHNSNSNNHNNNNNNEHNEVDMFITSGSGMYVVEKECITVQNLHDNANLLTCSLSSDDVYVATGGADGSIRITQWGAALSLNNNSITNNPNNTNEIIRSLYSNSVSCTAPVVATSFSSIVPNIVAAGCMDGKVHLVSYKSSRMMMMSSLVQNYNNDDDDDDAVVVERKITTTSPPKRVRCRHASNILSDHTRYIRDVCWSPSRSILATASADGMVHLYNVTKSMDGYYDGTDIKMSTSNDNDNDKHRYHNYEDVDNDADDEDDPLPQYNTSLIQSLNLGGSPVECIAFCGDNGDTLVCYARGTPYLSLFDLNSPGGSTGGSSSSSSSGNNTLLFEPKTKLNLNYGSVGTSAFLDHVSFTVMDIATSPNNSCNNNNNNLLALGTDTSRNIILDVRSNKQVRNLYGHSNDGYSQPKVGFSSNGQYLYGNTQNDTTMCVWDIATSKIIQAVSGGHTSTIRDLYSSPTTDTVVTVSFDKQMKLWFGPTTGMY